MAAKITAKNTELKFKPECFQATIRFSGYFLYYKNRCIAQKYIELKGKDIDIKQAWQRYWVGQVDKLISGILNGDTEDYTVNNMLKKISSIDSLGSKHFWIQRMARNLFVGDTIKPFENCSEVIISSIVKYGETLRIGYYDLEDSFYEKNFYINNDKQVSCLITIQSNKKSEIKQPI